jgi:hypothetical protein
MLILLKKINLYLGGKHEKNRTNNFINMPDNVFRFDGMQQK